MGIGRYILRARPLFKKESEFVTTAERLLSAQDAQRVKTLLKEVHCRPACEKVDTSLFGTLEMPQLLFSTDVARIETKFLNEKLWDSYVLERVREAGDSFFDRLVDVVAPHLVGLDMVKRAVTLQLLSDRLHILLVGDPGTGKTDILRSISELAPITSYGLGSGTTGVGLVVTMKGNDIKPGLLPMADGGICILDELNLMKEDSRAGLYNAMEKGFVTYDKGGNHEQLPARIRLLASANPIGGKLRGGSANSIRRQLPVDAPLLSRFHLVFTVQRPSAEEFEKIATSVVEKKKSAITPGDRDIVKRFCALARGMNPTVSKMVQEEVVLLASRIRDDEEDILIEITPRTVHGILDLARASARIVGRQEVTMLDVVRARDVFLASLEYGGKKTTSDDWE